LFFTIQSQNPPRPSLIIIGLPHMGPMGENCGHTDLSSQDPVARLMLDHMKLPLL
jgi:hypothetical protein